jgi:hypothetical protein
MLSGNEKNEAWGGRMEVWLKWYSACFANTKSQVQIAALSKNLKKNENWGRRREA